MAIDLSKGSFSSSYGNAIKLKNAITFSGIKNSLISFKSTASADVKEKISLISWGAEDKLGRIQFSNNRTTKTIKNPGNGLISEIQVSANEIKMYGPNNKLMANIKLEQGVDPNLLKIGLQNHKNFGLNIRYNDQSYIIYDMGPSNPSYVKIDGKFSAEINPTTSKQIAFRGNKNITSDKIALTEDELHNIVSNFRVGMLAGGFGSRLLANSGEGTKPTVEYGTSSFVNRVIHLAEEQGFKHFGAALYNKPEYTQNHIINGNPNVPIVFATQNKETGNLGTAGAVRHLVETMVGTELAEGLRHVDSLTVLSTVLDQFFGEEQNLSPLKNAIKKHLSNSTNFEADLKELLNSNHELRKNIFEARMSFAKDQYPGFLILSGDHCTNIDLRSFVKNHIESKAQLSVALQEVTPEHLEEMKHQNSKQCQLGVACVPDADSMRITEFKEKPLWAPTGKANELVFNEATDSWANTGIYIFSPEQILKIDSADSIIKRRTEQDAGEKAEMCDIGKHIIPEIVAEMKTKPDQANHLQGYSIEKTYWRTNANSALFDPEYTGLKGHIQEGRANWADLGTPTSLFDHLPTLIKDITSNNGKSTLIEHGPEGFDTDFIFRAAVSRHASYNPANITADDQNATLVVMDGARIHPNTRIAGSNYIGNGQDIPTGAYRNVWVSAQPNSLFQKPLNVVA